MPISLRLDRINLVSPEIRSRTSLVGVGLLSHHAIIFHRQAKSRLSSKLGILSVALSSLPLSTPLCTKLGFLSLSILPPHWFSTKHSHGSPFCKRFPPPLEQVHTQALEENRTHSQQSAHILQPHHTYILNPSHSARIS